MGMESVSVNMSMQFSASVISSSCGTPKQLHFHQLTTAELNYTTQSEKYQHYQHFSYHVECLNILIIKHSRNMLESRAASAFANESHRNLKHPF